VAAAVLLLFHIPPFSCSGLLPRGDGLTRFFGAYRSATDLPAASIARRGLDQHSMLVAVKDFANPRLELAGSSSWAHNWDLISSVRFPVIDNH